MQHHAVTEVVGLLRRDDPAELLLHLERVLVSIGDAQPSCDADAVGVADIALLPIDIAQHQIGGLAPHTGQGQQILHIVRHPAAEPLQQLLRRAHDVPGLGSPESTGVDILPHLVHIGGGKGLQRGVTGKQRWRHQIHPRVGALGRQPHGEQQLVVLAVV